MKHSPNSLRIAQRSAAALIALGSLAWMNHDPKPNTSVHAHTAEAIVVPPPTVAETTTTLPPTTTTMARVILKRASRGAVRPRLARPPIQDLPPEFWFDLTFCEDGHQLEDSKPNDTFHSYFQWQISSQWNTWHAAGGTGMPEEHSYEEQLEVAKGWASNTNPYQQWPVCWPKAMHQLEARQSAA